MVLGGEYLMTKQFPIVLPWAMLLMFARPRNPRPACCSRNTELPLGARGSLAAQLALGLVFLASCVAGHALQAEEAALQWKFTVGDQHHFRVNQSMTVQMDLGAAGAVETGVTQKLDLVWEVEAVAPQGLATIRQKVHRVRMELQAPGQVAVSYDTDSAEAPTGYAAMLAPTLQAFMELPLSITLTPRGKIQAVEIPEKLTTTLSTAPGAEMMGAMLTEAGMKKMLQGMTLELPLAADLVSGHQWTVATEMPNPQLGAITTRMTYTYQGPRTVDGEQWEVFQPRLEMQFGSEQVQVESQQTRGEMLFNRTHGHLESSTWERQASLRIDVAGQQIQQEIDQQVEFQRVAGSDPGWNGEPPADASSGAEE